MRGMPGAAAMLLDPSHSLFAVALEPNITGWSSDAKLGTQPAQILLTLLSPDDKLHALITYRHRSPRHSRPLLERTPSHCRASGASAAV